MPPPPSNVSFGPSTSLRNRVPGHPALGSTSRRSKLLSPTNAIPPEVKLDDHEAYETQIMEDEHESVEGEYESVEGEHESTEEHKFMEVEHESTEEVHE